MAFYLLSFLIIYVYTTYIRAYACARKARIFAIVKKYKKI